MSSAPTTSKRNEQLEILRKSGTQTDMYLKNGIKLRGKIITFDNESIIIDGERGQILVEVSALATFQCHKEPHA